jgi:ABC-type nitrate/sulfonate/bicarbonate transport system substrate-binding protein
MRALDLGFIALTDAAPLIVAQHYGFFEEENLRVTLRREVSWATIRDKVATGHYEGAHMLAPAVLALNLGIGSERADVIAPVSLNAHGAALGVSRILAAEMAAHQAPWSAAALAHAAAERRARGAPALSFAVVFPYSTHNYMLRAWAAAAGLNPDQDLRIVVAPPTAIAGRLRSGAIDGFCVGAPWGEACVEDSGAHIVLEAGAFWPGGPDKVLGLSGAWAKREPGAALAITRAVLRGARWADAPENAAALARLLAAPHYIAAPARLIAAKLGIGDAQIRFTRAHAAFPWNSHACWILSQMLRWGQIEPNADFARAIGAYRADLFEQAAHAIGLAPPPVDAAAPAPVADVNRSAFDLDSLKQHAAEARRA